jgi:hypothetical protein
MYYIPKRTLVAKFGPRKLHLFDIFLFVKFGLPSQTQTPSTRAPILDKIHFNFSKLDKILL